MKKILLAFVALTAIIAVRAESTVYLLVDARPTTPTFHVLFEGANNGETDINCPFIKNRFGLLPTHKKAVQKVTFKNDGRTVLSYKYENVAGTRDMSDAITLDLQNGETYYIQLISGDIKYKIKELTEKEYLKKMKKRSDYEINPDIVCEK